MAAAQLSVRPGELDSGQQLECFGPGAGERATEADEAYCRTDVPTFVGWRVYVEHCAGCHAEDALGSEFAPSLVHRLQRFDRRAFYSALDNGYLGRDAGLGPWGDDANVARYYEELWTYLSARADGRLPPVPLRPLRGAVSR